jgi:serine/threonine protein kinase
LSSHPARGEIIAAETPLSLSSGVRLGPYEILAPLGAGGMGEVYRARDTRLGREVAIKIFGLVLTPDGKTYAYTIQRRLSTLCLVTGLR